MAGLESFDQELEAAGLISDSIEDAYPLSPMQAGLVATTLQSPSQFNQRVQDDPCRQPPYFTHFFYRLKAPRHVQELEHAWRSLVSRHPILRTVYLETAEHPDGIVQVVLEPEQAQSVLAWEFKSKCTDAYHDAKCYLLDQGQVVLQRQALEKRPVFWHCAGVFVPQLEPELPVFALGMHHSLYDGWSLALILRELQLLYQDSSYLERLKPTTPFSTFIEHCLDPDLQVSARAYWKKTLAELSTADWPHVRATAGPVPSPTSKHASILDSHHLDLCFDATYIEAAAARLDVTTASLFKAALAYTVSRHSGSTDVVIGYVDSGRSMEIEGIEDITGPCISSLPLRLCFEENKDKLQQGNVSSERASGPSVFQVVSQAEKSSVEAMEHQQLGLDGIMACCNLQSLFSILLAFQNLPSSAQKDNKECFVPIETQMQTSYPLVLQVELQGGQCHIHFEYQTAYLSQKQMEYFSLHLQQSLREFSRIIQEGFSNDTDVSTIDIRSESEKQQDWQLTSDGLATQENQKQALLPWHRQVQLIARNTPRKVAVQSFEGVFWTYEELWHRSVLLSNRIRDELQLISTTASKPEQQLMPVALQKRPSTVVLLLALAILGLAYVPCDPGQPEARLNRILEQTNSTWLLTNGCNPLCRPETHVVDVEDWIRQQSEDDMLCIDTGVIDTAAVNQELDKLCYQLFTSGSSGMPKGVQVSHLSVAASIHAQKQLYERCSQPAGNDNSAWDCCSEQKLWTHRCLQFSQLSFDWSVWDLGCLSHGSTLCFRPMDDMLSEMEETMNTMRITLLQTTPTVVKLFEADRNNHLSLLCLSGEQLTRSVADSWTRPGVRLINAYGITEITVVCTAQDDVDANTPVSLIGQPLGLNRVLVVDEHNRQSPFDCPGELIVCGAQVAEGYAGDIERTRASFVSLHDGKIRAYRSGDIVVFDSEHNALRYLHRRDKQTNIKGLRVELGEVEAGLRRCCVDQNESHATMQLPRVSSILVEAVNDEMVAFIAFSSTQPGKAKRAELGFYFDKTHQNALQELARNARSQLSQYMIPTTWVAISHLPLGSSGKLDRRMLLDQYHLNLDEIRKALFSHTTVSHVVPDRFQDLDDAVIKTLRLAWSKVLGQAPETLALDNTFGFVGGDSILAIRLSALLRKQSLNLSVSQIQNHPTIRDQAHLLQTHKQCSSKVAHSCSAATEDDAHTQPAHAQGDSGWWKVAELFAASTGGRIASEDIQACYPATGTQEMMLLGSMIGSPECYHVQQLFRISKSTDLARLKSAFQTLVQRHDILRTVFTFGHSHEAKQDDKQEVTARLFQVVLRYSPLHWQQRRLPGRLEQYQPTELYCLNGTSWKRWKRDLPMSCFRFIQFEEGEEDALLWTIHHALDDAWTVDLQLKELELLYRSGLGVSPHEDLVDSPSFGLVIKHINELKDEALGQFWVQELEGIKPCSLVAEARAPLSRPLMLCSKAELEKKVPIPAQLSKWLQRHNLSLSTAVIGAFSITLSQLWKDISIGESEEDREVVFGQMLSGRSSAVEGLEVIVGPCISVVPRRVTIPGPLSAGQMVHEDSLVKWLTGIQVKQAEISDNELVGYADLARSGKVSFDHTQLFDTMLNYRNFTHRSKSESELSSGQLLKSWDGSDPFDVAMALNISALEDRLDTCLNYDSKWLSPWLAGNILDRFCQVLLLFTESRTGAHVKNLTQEIEVADGLDPRGRTRPSNNSRASDGRSSDSSTPSSSSRSSFSQSTSSADRLALNDTPAWGSSSTLSHASRHSDEGLSFGTKDGRIDAGDKILQVCSEAKNLLQFGAACVMEHRLDVQPSQLFDPDRLDALQDLMNANGLELIDLASHHLGSHHLGN